ncbi:MAG: hypothetical protein GX224_04325 [Thermoplasmatales archaeon]|nr:hypothetical protein [Thermoplasmatales archaeon]
MDERGEVVKELMRLPSVSEKCCQGMYLLGIKSVDDLKDKDPEEMYASLRSRTDFHAEPCMQAMLKIAVGMARKGVFRQP